MLDKLLPALVAIAPKVPLIGTVALRHTLGLSEHSEHWDLWTEIYVNLLRSFLNNPNPDPLSYLQLLSLRDPGIKGRIWVSKVSLLSPLEEDVKEQLCEAIERTKGPNEHRGGIPRWRNSAITPIKDPGAQQYTEMMREVSKPTTVLYLHGGAYCMLGPQSHRRTTQKLAQSTGGRCLSVKYRLAPQNPFPSALLDVLVAYLALLYPPPDSLHTAVEARHIVVSGDSAGGGLSLALLQTLLEFRRREVKIRWFGEDRDIPLPAGVATISAWVDILQSSPSCEENRAFDYIPVPTDYPDGMNFPPCPIWPAKIPRSNIYAVDSLLCNPLVSPLAAQSWEGSCPLFIEVGQESLTDEGKHIASKAATQSVKVVFEEYEAMPHCFALIFEGLPGAMRCIDRWSKFINDAVERPDVLETKGTKIKAISLKKVNLAMNELSLQTDEEVKLRMKKRQQKAARYLGATSTIDILERINNQSTL